jgi:hypothetical protein
MAQREGRESRSGVRYDERVGQCRDESGQFVECPPEMKRQGMSTGNDPNKERIAARGGQRSSRRD